MLNLARNSSTRVLMQQLRRMGTHCKVLVNSTKLPKPIAPYNQAVRLDDTLYVSGVLGMCIDGKLIGDGMEDQTRKALENLGVVLKAGGSCYNNVIKTTVFLYDINDYDILNRVYKEFFKQNFPARSAFQVGKLPMDAKVEIEAVAAVGDIKIAKQLV